MRENSRNPLRLIGGNYALNWRNHPLFAIPAFISAGLFDFDRLGGDPAFWLLTATVGFFATAGSIEALRPLALRFAPGPARSVAVSVTLLIAGFFRGGSIFLVGSTLGIIPPEDLAFRLIGGPIFVFSIYVLTSSILENYLNYRNQLATLNGELEKLERFRTSYSKDLQQINRDQRNRVRELLAAPMWELQKKLKSAKDPTGLRDALLSMQAINNDVVRPLSHELGTEKIKLPDEFDSGKNLALRSVFPSRLRLAEVQSLALLLTVILSIGLNAQIGTTSPVEGILNIGLSSSIILPLFILEQRTIGRISLPAGLAILISAGLGFVFGALAGLANVQVGFANTPTYWLQAGIYLLITKLLILFFGVFDQSWRNTIAARGQVAEELRRLNSRLRQQLWLGQKSLAMELHGSVQGTLQALAARLSRMEEPNISEIDEILEKIRDSLNRIETEDYLAGGDMGSLLENLKDLWDGTLEIKWNISEDAADLLARDLGLARCVFEIIREAVTNSVKHGEAKSVAIEISLGKALRLEITNDGKLSESTTGYAGSELFDQLCLSHAIRNVGTGVVFEAELALSPEAEL